MRNEEPKVPLAPILVIGYWLLEKVFRCLGIVGSRQSAVGSKVAFGDFIRRLSFVDCRLNKNVVEQRIPKSFTIHHSPFTIRKRSFQFLIPHSSFLIFAPKGAN